MRSLYPKEGTQEGCRVLWGKDGEENWRESFNIHSRKLASRPVFLHIPTGGGAAPACSCCTDSHTKFRVINY